MKLGINFSLRRLLSFALVISLSLICALAYNGAPAVDAVLPAHSAVPISTPPDDDEFDINAYLPYGYTSNTTITAMSAAPIDDLTEDIALSLLLLHEVSLSEQTAVEAEAIASAAKAAAEAALQIEVLRNQTIEARTVMRTDDLLASEAVQLGSTSLGNFRLSFYCPCAICNGRDDGLTATGVVMSEGRTIAVDPEVIPLGSRVYIDGYGLFIAEDVGGAISENRIDVCVSEHEYAFVLGVDYADVYLIS